MPSRWPSAPGADDLPVWSITPTAGSSTWRSATPSDWPRPRPLSSVGSRGDSYDNALAETVNGLYKAELINRHGPWRSVEAVELATADWVHFWNTKRLHGACGDIPPAEFEAAYHSAQAATAAA